MANRRPLQFSLLLLLFGGLAALATNLGLADGPAEPPRLSLNQPIERVDRTLRSQGWHADGDPDLASFDRELAANGLASLRSCSGTGAGFCRYDYRRGRQRLEVITVPSADGDGLVHHWQLRDGEADPP